MTAFTKKLSRLLALAVAGLPALAAAQLSYPGCADVQPSELQKTTLFARTAVTGSAHTVVSALSEPVAMALAAVTAGDSVIGADVYVVERKGAVRKYDFATKTVKQIGFVTNAETNANRQGDNGLMGIALDPNFATNRWVYLWYSPVRANNNANYRGRLSRFTLGANDTLQPGSEKILIDILLSKTHQWHAGGPMRFDKHGDLWLTIGNNGNDLSGSGSQYSMTDSNQSQEWGASNTANMRGGVIRIHPDESAPKGYTIPAGNFGEYWANYFEANSNASLAAQYRDTSKVLPEIYVKGSRSNFSIAVHPTRRWLAWGEVNYQSNNEEFNLFDKPVFAGFPYFHKNNVATPGNPPNNHPLSGVTQTVASPKNLSPLNTGVIDLPPAQAPQIWTGNSVTATTIPVAVARSGDIYVYDPALKGRGQFPPHIHNTWLLMNWSSGGTSPTAYLVRIDSTTVTTTGTPFRVDNGLLGLTSAPNNLRAPLQMSYGPDGALYILNYGGYYNANTNPGVIRVAYTGSCLPATAVTATRPLSEMRMVLSGARLQVFEEGRHEVTLIGADGREVFRASGEAGAIHDLNGVQGLRQGVHFLRVKTDRGVFARSLPLL